MENEGTGKFLGFILCVILCGTLSTYFFKAMPDGLLDLICHCVFCFDILISILIASYGEIFNKKVQTYKEIIFFVEIIVLAITGIIVNYLKFFKGLPVSSPQLFKITMLFSLNVVGYVIRMKSTKKTES